MSYSENAIIAASYEVKDDNGELIKIECCDKPPINAEYEGFSNLRKHPITSDYGLLTFEYEGVIYRYVFSTECLDEGVLSEIIIPVTKDSSQYMTLRIKGKSFSDYPTDGEETFISRLLSADTVASAKAELEKCILGE